MPLADTIRSLHLEKASVAVSWIGQSGYVFKTSAGRTILIDPYLSDAAEDLIGVPRIASAPFAPDELVPDVLLITHSDLDHLDMPTVRAYAAHGSTFLAAPATSITRARARCGWSSDASAALKPAETCSANEINITATFARHSDADLLTQDSIGFAVELDDLVIWHAGDTEYDSRLRWGPAGTIDLALLPINGTGGNMNAHEAALLAWQIGARVVVPMHYGMWAAEDYTYRGLDPHATLDPEVFADTYRRLGGMGQVVVLHVGEIVRLQREPDGRVTVDTDVAA